MIERDLANLWPIHVQNLVYRVDAQIEIDAVLVTENHPSCPGNMSEYLPKIFMATPLT